MDSNPKEINAVTNQSNEYKESFAENPDNQGYEPVGTEKAQMNENRGNPEAVNNIEVNASKIVGNGDEMKE